jgi:23S rRNA (uracil-5-)-methyltransferase RumA
MWRSVISDLGEKLERAEPRCPHFGLCGGCSLQNYSYQSQLLIKVESVRRIFERMGLRVSLGEPVRAVEEWFYRNRMDYVAAPGPKIGLRKLKSKYAVVDIGRCLLQSEGADRVRNGFRDFLQTQGLPPYDLRRKRGLVRYLVIREGKRTGRRTAIVLVTKPEFPFDEFCGLGRELGCTGFALAVYGGPADISVGEVVRYAGEPLSERVGRFEFWLSPYSFFQTNSRMAERLVEVVREFAGAGDRLADLYCGVGLFGISLSENFARVTGIEADPFAAEDARKNAELNGADNFSVIEAKVEKAGRVDADVAIVDPPRAGMHPKAIKLLLKSEIGRLVYVSCNPETMARDLRLLEERYELRSPVHLLDMFPWTPHVELVAGLVRK